MNTDVHVYVCIYMYMYVYIYIYLYMYVYVYRCTCIYTCTCMCMYSVCMCTYILHASTTKLVLFDHQLCLMVMLTSTCTGKRPVYTHDQYTCTMYSDNT